jgi:hypothetical protein
MNLYCGTSIYTSSDFTKEVKPMPCTECKICIKITAIYGIPCLLFIFSHDV